MGCTRRGTARTPGGSVVPGEIALGAGLGRGGSHLGAVVADSEPGAITAVDMEKGRLTSKLDVRFSDGSVAQVEAVKGAKPEKLVEAIGVH